MISPIRTRFLVAFGALASIAAVAHAGLPQPTSTSTPTPNVTRTPTPTSTAVHNDDLGIVLSASPNPVAPGALLTYDFQVTNHTLIGSTHESFVQDNLPSEVAFVSCTTFSQGFSACSHGGNLVTADLGPLGGGGTARMTVVVQVNASSGTITNTATVSHTGPDPVGSNNTSTVSTVIGIGPTFTPTASATATPTPTPLGGGNGGGSGIPVSSPAARAALLAALVAGGVWLLRRS